MDALTAIADEYYDYAMSESPVSLMWNGKLEHLAEWDDFTAEGAAERRATQLAFAARIEAIDPGDEPTRIALHAVLVHHAKASAGIDTWRSELFHVNPRMGAWEMVMSFVDNFPLTTRAHGDAYLQKLTALPGAFAQLGEAARQGADAGVVALARHLSATVAQITSYLESPTGPEDRLCSQAPPTELDADQAAAWSAERNRIVAEVVRPGLTPYVEALRALALRGMPDDRPGLVHLPGGEEVYAGMVWGHLLVDRTPAEIHQLGLDQVARLEEEYLEIAGPLLGTDDIAQIYARLRDDESLKYRDSEPLVADAELALKRADAALPAWFSRLPESECLATATPYGAMAYYSAPDPDAGKPGRFYFNTSNPSAWSTYELEAIVYHEGVPGHHLQLALNAENRALHRVQREFFNTAYAEGWGLYAERLADEMGLYTSPLARVGMLLADSLRACRLVVDTGMHALGWSREAAIQYMLDHSPMDRAHIEQEVDRYIGLPGQALAYMVGRLEIQAIRREAELRDGFDIRDFHDRVLRNGAVPLTTLRHLVLGAEQPR